MIQLLHASGSSIGLFAVFSSSLVVLPAFLPSPLNALSHHPGDNVHAISDLPRIRNFLGTPFTSGSVAYPQAPQNLETCEPFPLATVRGTCSST